MKRGWKFLSFTMALCVAAVALTACTGKGNFDVLKADFVTSGGASANSLVAVYSGAGYDRTYLTNAQVEALVTDNEGYLTIGVASNVHEVEFDVIKLFEKKGFKSANYMTHSDFYFTRDDVKVDDTEQLRRGVTLVMEDDTVSPTTWTSPHLNVTTPASKDAIVAAKGSAAAVRLYYDNVYGENGIGRARIYADSTTSSTLAEGETKIVYTFHGKNSEKATLKVKIVKAV